MLLTSHSLPSIEHYLRKSVRIINNIQQNHNRNQNHKYATASRMTSYFSKLSPIPGFPNYTGPHKVGTIDVEFSVGDLDSPSPAPSDNIGTVQYRIFYPCEPDAKGKPINWIPAPQRGYVSAYTRFLGAGDYLAEFIS